MGLLQKLKDIQFLQTQIKEYKSLSANNRRVVFYAESKADWNYLGPIVESLNEKHGVFVSYLTSDNEDPQLKVRNDLFASFYVGQGTALTILFKTFDCELLVTSLPDIETFHLKRSVNDVHYMYVFHSMASTQALYREAAFDNYDTIFTVGPHHDKEIRTREKQKDLPQKTLVPHGYGRLDKLIEEVKGYKQSKHEKPLILVGSSWGPNSITDRCAIPLVRTLLDAGMEVIYRPHPMSQWHAQDKLNDLKKAFENEENFTYETNMRVSNSLLESDALITEWSGIALEYAFSQGKPVYSIDTPRKVNNPKYEELGLETLEDWIRHDIGAVIPEDSLGKVVDEINKNLKNPQKFAKKAFQLRDKWIYNVGHSGKVAADYIAEKLKAKRK